MDLIVSLHAAHKACLISSALAPHLGAFATHHYVEADLTMKDRALARLQEPDSNIRRYRAPDSLLEFLKTL